MSREVLTYMLAGLIAIAVAVAGIFYLQRGAHIRLDGAILKVRTLPADERSSVVIIDFRFVNPADYPFIVRRVDVSVEDRHGNVWEGSTISDVDAQRLFEYYPILGQRYNESLVMRTRIEPRQSMDRMLAARFEIPEAELEARHGLRIQVAEVDGAYTEIVE